MVRVILLTHTKYYTTKKYGIISHIFCLKTLKRCYNIDGDLCAIEY